VFILESFRFAFGESGGALLGYVHFPVSAEQRFMFFVDAQVNEAIAAIRLQLFKRAGFGTNAVSTPLTGLNVVVSANAGIVQVRPISVAARGWNCIYPPYSHLHPESRECKRVVATSGIVDGDKAGNEHAGERGGADLARGTSVTFPLGINQIY
jgi:hypothetical protein